MTELTAEIQFEESQDIQRRRNFRWLWMGSVTSMLGDQLSLVAFPWLVLSLTADPRVLGVALALIGLPRAVFILLGGAIVDRLSPKSVLLSSKYMSVVFLTVLSLLIYTQQLTIPMLCVFAFLIGVSSAFAMPASSSIIPEVVGRECLEKANGFIMLLRQVAMFIGPLMAGVILGADAHSDQSAGHNLAIVFGLDGLTFLLSAFTLFQVSYKPLKTNVEHLGIFHSVYEGLCYFWADIHMRALILYMAAASCILGGLVQVGLPILVKQQLSAGADSYGYLLAVGGIGTIIGVLIAVKRPQIGSLNLGVTCMIIDGVSGLLFASLSIVETIFQAYTILFLVGLLGGYLQLGIFTWVQKQSSPKMLGRMMSIMLFTFMGLAPVAAAVYGTILSVIEVGHLFFISGLALAIVAVFGLCLAPIRAIHRHAL